MKTDELLGYCGLYCGNCLFYQNTVKGTGTDPGDGMIYMCRGCNSGEVTPWCTDCGIKTSCRNKEIRTCIECDSFPCDMMNGFMNDPEYPYHRDVPEMMRLLDEMGLEAWAEEMKKRYTCDTCGEQFTYFDRKCPRCK